MKLIALNLIRTDGGTQMRAELHKDTYLEYRDVWLSSPGSFPPLVLFFDGLVYWLADGFHRFYGAREALLETVPADVREGTQRDAILYAVGANQLNGLRRTNLDKRRAVETLLNDTEWVAWSDHKVAEQSGVSHNLVREVRNQLASDASSPASGQADKPRKGKDGKLRKPRKPKLEMLCERCARVGIVKDCVSCTEVRKAAKKAKAKKAKKEKPATGPEQCDDGPPEPDEPLDVPCDGNGVPWSGHALVAIEVAPKFKEMSSQLSKMAKTIVDDESLRLYTFSIQSVIAGIRTLQATLLDAIPSYVCPYCDGTLKTVEGPEKGKACEVCCRQGWVSKSTCSRSPKGASLQFGHGGEAVEIA